MKLLQVEGLRTYFYTYEGVVKALEGIGFDMDFMKTLGLVGETGCGKSVTAMSIARLIPSPPGKILGGRVFYKGKDLRKASEAEMRSVRGKEISMIFQEPRSALNPVIRAGEQIAEVLYVHDEEIRSIGDQKEKEKKAMERVYAMLGSMGIPNPERIASSYPHELSGGMCQRVMIAMAMICNPSLLIADEPTTALDVTIQAQILELMKEMIRKYRSSVLLITHNLGVVADICDDVAVMYAGQIVERGMVEKIFAEPAHPYTSGLIRAVPNVEKDIGRLETIPGSVPNLINPPAGCRFHPRCDRAMDVCRESVPPVTEISDGHGVSCWLYGGA